VISWRYHLISIVAVFLALGLGVLAGTTVLNDNLVRNLKGQTQQLRSDLSDLRKQVDDYRTQLATMNAFADQAMPYVVGSKLANEDVVVVTEDGVDGRALAETRKALDLAGAHVLTTLTVHPSLAAGTPGAQQDLATLLGLPQDATPEELEAAAAQTLAERLAKDPRAALVGQTDPLGELLSQGFVTASGPGLSDTTLQGIGGRGQMVVTIGGGGAALTPPSSALLVPFVGDLVTLGVVTGAGESVAADDGFISGVRGAPNDSGNPLVTVDNADMPIGSSAMVLGLQSVLFGGPGGDYGIKADASRLLPPPA
jgi:hypothetical protein